MVSPTFLKLYGNAMHQEQAVLAQLNELWSAGVVSTFPQAVRMSRALLDMHDDYIDGLENAVLRHQMRVRQPLRGVPCPDCGQIHDSPEMGGAVPTLLGISLLKAVFTELGLMPPEPPE
jgi:hypothetical protein